ncbi:MAG: methyltransferase domain-containing protein [Candidatus Micrarchaeia archaeon]
MKNEKRHPIKPYLTDDLTKLQRGAAVVLPKDFGIIVAYTGLTRDSVVAEAGTGTGFMAVQLARIAKKVYSYENREEHYETAKLNLDRLHTDNVELRLGSIENLDVDNLDMIFLDFKGSDALVGKMRTHLKDGGFIVGYCPNIEQAKSFHLNAENSGYKKVFTLTTSVTDYEIREFGCRPAHFGLLHTAYLVFAKK